MFKVKIFSDFDIGFHQILHEIFSNSCGLPLVYWQALSVIIYIFNSFFRKKYHVMAIIHSCSFSYYYMYIQIRQFDHTSLNP